LVGSLHGVEKEVAVKSYEDALKGLFLYGAGLAAVMVLVQAGTGWRGAGEDKVVEGEADEVAARAYEED